MRTLRRGLLTLTLAGLVFAAEASAAVTIGGDTSTSGDGQTGCGAEACTIVQSASAAASYVVPIDGVIVRWRIRTANGTGAWRIRALSNDGMDNFSGAGMGSFETVAPGAERVFAARVPVLAGTRLALDGPSSATSALRFVSAPGSSIRTFRPPIVEGAAPQSSDGSGSGFQMLYNADIEPDADRDGFGDETQDQCPTNAALQVECVLPETTITKAPRKKIKTKKRRKKVTFAFAASEPAGFQCRLGAAEFLPCVSPFKVKLRRGKHRFQVRSIDLAGNVETTPATARVKIKRRR